MLPRKHAVQILLLISISYTSSQAQHAALKERIQILANNADGNVGIAVLGLEDNDTIAVHGDVHYPMQSVFKLHLGMAILEQVDNKKILLNEKIHVTQRDLLPTYSSLRHEHPTGEFDITVADLLHNAVSLSDNNACDILFRLIGGPKMVNDYVHHLGIHDIAIAATEEEMTRAWNVQFTNWTTPRATVKLLQMLCQGTALSSASRELLLQEMTSTPRGNDRIKGLLPTGTVVAHKPGTSGTNADGVTAATNDVGVITLPNGKHIALAVFISNSKASGERRASVIAEVSKAVWDYFTSKE